MRIIITTLIVVLNFILQTTLFPYLAIQGVFPNTALIIVTSYSLLRGSKEGALVGAGTGFLMDVFFHTYIGFYTALYLLIGLIFGRSQRSFFRENYILPIIFCAIATIFYQAVLYVSSFVPRRRKYSLFPLPRAAAGAGLYDDCNRSAVSGAVWHQ